MLTIKEFTESGAYRALNPRNKAVIDILLDHASRGQHATVDHIRRKLQTKALNVDEALLELSGAFEQVEYDPSEKVAMWDIAVPEDIDEANAQADIPDHAASPYLDPETGNDVQVPDETDDAERDATDQSDIPASEDMRSQQLEAADDEDDEDHKTPFRFGGKNPAKYRALYKEHGGHCGDDIGELMTAHVNVTRNVPRKDGKGYRKIKFLDMDAVYEVARQNHIDHVNGSNNGQVRMNLSNMLRKLHREGKDVHIGTAVVKGRTEAEHIEATRLNVDAQNAAATEYAAEAARNNNEVRAPQF